MEPGRIVFDWRQQKVGDRYILSDVKKQLDSTCFIHALVATSESRYKISMARQGEPLDEGFELSVPYAKYCAKYSPIVGNFLRLRDALDMGKTMGFVSSLDFDSDTVHVNTDAQYVYVRDYEEIFSKKEDREMNAYERAEIVNELTQNGPLLAKILAFHQLTDGSQIYTNGGERYTGPSGRLGAHAITLVGINDEQGYWIYQNSYGKEWGENGFGKIDPAVIRKIYALRM